MKTIIDALYFLNEFFFYDHNILDCVEKLDQIRKCLIYIFKDDK